MAGIGTTSGSEAFSLLQPGALNTSAPTVNTNNTAVHSMGSEASRVAQMIITILIFLVGIPLNLLVVWVLGVRGWRREGKRASNSSFGVYVVNLALADLVLVMRTPLALGYLANHFHWPFGLPACRLVMFLRVLGLYANAFLLCAISMERCLCLLRPVWYRLRRRPWVVHLVCGLLWVLAFSLSTPYIATSQIKSINSRSQCMPSGKLRLALFITETLLGFLLPLLLFLSCNLAVLLTARQVEGASAARASISTLATSSSASSSPSPSSQRYTRLYRVLFLTMLLFLTCWVPYFTFRFLGKLSEYWQNQSLTKVFYRGEYTSLYLVYLKSALNPVLYVFAGKGLGGAVKASLLSAVERIFNEDTSDYSRRRSLRGRDSLV
ncbi:C3a anaphylatoxin chemotactic receptor [Amia ocellicauda]|uniref:C3a anaphylatoxin chemotactic receptor n=1 Tax=Amia ocellicauda TaxID=2972642 RepID=UPI003464A7A9